MTPARKATQQLADELRDIALAIEDDSEDPYVLISGLKAIARRLEELREDHGWNVINLEDFLQ